MPFRKAALGHRRVRKILYRWLGLAAIFAAFISLATWSVAQEETPEITPRVKKPVKKNEQNPRALGLLQLTSNGKATLVPIAIRVNGKFYDATAYKAAPVPMALEPGTVYEGERTGTSVGLFTINGALRSQAQNTVAPWIGTGMWLPAGTNAPNTALKAEKVPLGIETTDEPPRLSKSGSTTKESPAGTPSPSTTSQTPSGTTSGSAPPAAAPPKQSPTGPTDKSPQSHDKDNSKDKDKDAKTSEPPPAQSAEQPATSGDTNRPRLRRGKPTQSLPDDDVPGYSKPNSAGNAAAAATAGASASNTTVPGASVSGAPVAQGTIQLVPAISDADGPDPRSYAYEWNKGDEEDRRKQMLALAKEQLRGYISGREKLTTKSDVPNANATARKPAPKVKAAEPVFDRSEMRTFDLWASNQPILILSAEAHVPPAVAGRSTSGSSTAETVEYSITLAARIDIYSNLHKLYFALTDKYHLDVAPRLELIDAVDAEGDGRGELLFRETTDNGAGYAIYRATADSLWKMYDSLRPE
jgi:hypothetical protein